MWIVCIFFFQAEDGIRDDLVTGVQTCALPIFQLIAAGRAIRNAVLANDDESRNRHTDAVLQRLQLLKEALNNSKRLFAEGDRSEERRVGKEGRSRWSPYH